LSAHSLVEVFWAMMSCSVVVGHHHFRGPCYLHIQDEVPEDGGSPEPRNVGVLPQHYTASQTRRIRFKSSSPWTPQISHRSIQYTFWHIYLLPY